MRFTRVLMVAAVFAVGAICFSVFSDKIGGCGSNDDINSNNVVNGTGNVKSGGSVGGAKAEGSQDVGSSGNAGSGTFSPSQVQKIELIVHDYLIKNPQVMVEVIQELQGQLKVEEQERVNVVRKLAIKHNKEIFDTKAPGRIVVGNNNPKVIITEFFGYQCPICRISAPAIEKILNDNKDLQMIFIPWPFEGKADIYAAQTALAAQRQGKFWDVHRALLALPGILTNEQIDRIAVSSGLNMEKLKKDRDDKVIIGGIKANFKLSQDLSLIGTPSFFITNAERTKFHLFPGKTSLEEIQQAIKEVR